MRLDASMNIRVVNQLTGECPYVKFLLNIIFTI